MPVHKTLREKRHGEGIDALTFKAIHMRPTLQENHKYAKQRPKETTEATGATESSAGPVHTAKKNSQCSISCGLTRNAYKQAPAQT